MYQSNSMGKMTSEADTVMSNKKLQKKNYK